MSVISIETKRIPALASVTGLSENDMIVVELADGGTKKMLYRNLLTILREALIGGDSQVLMRSDIVTVMTNDGTKIPSAKLLYDLNESLAPLVREQMCINAGLNGKVQDIDVLMDYVANEEYNKFAIGDAVVDSATNVTWRIFAKRHYPRWAFDSSTADDNVAPPHIILLPDTALGQYAFNPENTNSGGYPGSKMPANMETEFNKLGSKLKSYVVPTQIFENSKGGWASTMRNMRLPTVIETFGMQGWADVYSGGVSGQLPLMKSVRHRIKSYWYWLLDPSAANTTRFCVCSNYGASSDCDASYAGGSVRPIIVLSKTKY